MPQQSVKNHFDQLAEKYDLSKSHAWYYYNALKDIVVKNVEPHKRVLEVGCGTGNLLFLAKPEFGVGVDISEKMISIAKQKYRAHKNLSFVVSDITAYETDTKFDYMLFFDVIEHLEQKPESIKRMGEIAKPGTILVASMANPLWEFFLLFLEKVGLKMQEGPHYRISLALFKALLGEAGFEIIREGRKMIIPLYIPLISNAANSLFERLPIAKDLCLIQYLICRKI